MIDADSASDIASDAPAAQQAGLCGLMVPAGILRPHKHDA